MNLRKTMVTVHLALAAFFLPWMLILPISGAAHLWDLEGEPTREEAFRITATAPDDEGAREAFFREQFATLDPNFSFEYVRASRGDFTFRPSSRVHYTAKQAGEEIVFTRVDPPWLNRFMELHKGHGPWIMRWFEAFFGVALVLTTLSGVWLGWTVPSYRRTMLITGGLGLVAMALTMI